MKFKVTPANSPSVTFCFVAPRVISPTFCQSASVGDPTPTPGILRIADLISSAAKAEPAIEDIPPLIAATAPAPAAPFKKVRLLALLAAIAYSYSDFFIFPPYENKIIIFYH